MNWSKVGRWVHPPGSLVIGIVGGLGGFWIFELKVPTAMQNAMVARRRASTTWSRASCSASRSSPGPC